jgi:hypothetical protein
VQRHPLRRFAADGAPCCLANICEMRSLLESGNNEHMSVLTCEDYTMRK